MFLSYTKTNKKKPERKSVKKEIKNKISSVIKEFLKLPYQIDIENLVTDEQIDVL